MKYPNWVYEIVSKHLQCSLREAKEAVGEPLIENPDYVPAVGEPTIPNPDYNPEQPAGPDNPETIKDPEQSEFIDNPEDQGQFVHRIVRQFLAEHVNAYELKVAKEEAAAATKIQAAFRGKPARKEAETLKKEKTAAARAKTEAEAAAPTAPAEPIAPAAAASDAGAEQISLEPSNPFALIVHDPLFVGQPFQPQMPGVFGYPVHYPPQPVFAQPAPVHYQPQPAPPALQQQYLPQFQPEVPRCGSFVVPEAFGAQAAVVPPVVVRSVSLP